MRYNLSMLNNQNLKMMKILYIHILLITIIIFTVRRTNHRNGSSERSEQTQACVGLLYMHIAGAALF